MWTESSSSAFAINTCRICAISSEVLIPIFGTVDDHKERVDYKIIKYLPIMVRKNDSKPKYICFSCISKLEVCRELHELSRASDFKFNNMLFSSALISKEGTSASIEDPPPAEDVVFMVELQYKESQQNQLQYKDTQQDTLQNAVTKSALENSPEIHGQSGDPKSCTMLQTDDGDDPVSQACGPGSPLLLFSPETERLPTGGAIAEEPTATEAAATEAAGGAKAAKSFPCLLCGKTYRRKTNLNGHMGTHTQVRAHACADCGACFALRRDLTLHARLHANAFACAICAKPFPARSKLERHARTHTGERPFVCLTCGRAFGDKRNLAGHERTHSDVRPFACSVCGRGFRVRAHLKEHSRVHSKVAAFTCDVCGKRFKWKTNLNIHLKVHSGSRHSCADCGREFSRRSDLVKHRRAHLAEAAQACAKSEASGAVEDPALACSGLNVEGTSAVQ